jgi:hypothetical protein
LLHLSLFYSIDMIELLLPCGFDTLEYSWVKATIGICMLADYSMAKKYQQGSYFPLFLVSVLLHIVISRGFGLKGSFLPPCPRSHQGSTPKPPPLLLCLPPFIFGTIGFPPHHILR